MNRDRCGRCGAPDELCECVKVECEGCKQLRSQVRDAARFADNRMAELLLKIADGTYVCRGDKP